MFFQPILTGAIGAQLGRSVAPGYLLLTMLPALLLIYFCVLAWKEVFHDDESPQE